MIPLLGATLMKRTVFRVSVVGIVVALGLLAIAHAQRTDPPPDDGPTNPLRNGQPQPATGGGTGNSRNENVGPVDTDVPPRDNPFRNGSARSDGRVQPLAAEEPQGTAPTRIRLIAGGEPAVGNPGNSGGTIRAMGEPRHMPPTADRYAVPAEPPSAAGGVSGPRMASSDSGNTYRPGSTRNAFPDDEIRPSNGNGTGQPGSKQLEGPQTPQVIIQKIVPPEIQVGRPAVLKVVVRNTGAVAASGVEIHDQVPRGTQLLGTTPQASQDARGELVWSLGTLKPGGEATVEMQVRPIEEGEVGSIATVRFQADATARSIVTQPRLVIETTGTNRVLVGDYATLTFTVSNPGSGTAIHVVLAEHIPDGLEHPGGKDLEYTVGDLKPGDRRQLQLRMKALKAGPIANVIVAKADAELSAKHQFNLEVTSPQLDIALAGPKRRYLEREATYQLSVSNPGTAPAQQIELAAYLPQGLKFVKASHAGRYDEVNRAVYWRMEELGVNQPGTVELVTMPVAAGQFSIKVRAAAQRVLVIEKEQPVLVEGLAAVLFQLSHTKDPVEIGGETTYEVTVANQGSKASSNLQLSILLPPELKPLAAEGPTQHTIKDNSVVFESLAKLEPKSVAAFRVRAQGIRAGDLRVRCELMTDELQRPVIKEESTRVYGDE